MNYLIILFAIILIGCAGAPERMAIDSRFTSDERAVILEAIAEWSEATDSDLSIDTFELDMPESMADGEPRFLATTSANPGYGEGRPPGVNASGVYRESDQSIVVFTDRIDDVIEFRRTILHELGHVHGMMHIDSGLMRSDTGARCTIACITDDDLEAYCAEFECGPNAHSTCGR